MRKNKLFTGGFWYDFSGSQAASCKHFEKDLNPDPLAFKN
jgi:hypothetical protein